MKMRTIALLQALGWLTLYFSIAFIIASIGFGHNVEELFIEKSLFPVRFIYIVFASIAFFQHYRQALRKIRQKKSTVESLSEQ